MSKKLSDFTPKDFEKLSKSIPKFEQFKSIYNLDNDFKPEIPEIEQIENPVYALLEFLQSSTLEQSETSKRQSKNINIQFKITTSLMIITVIIGLLSLIPIFFSQNNNQYKSLYEHTITLEKTILKQDYTISQLSNNLLDLQNQVRILEKQNGEISKKKND